MEAPELVPALHEPGRSRSYCPCLLVVFDRVVVVPPSGSVTVVFWLSVLQGWVVNMPRPGAPDQRPKHAICNAIYAAAGKRITALPVYRAGAAAPSSPTAMRRGSLLSVRFAIDSPVEGAGFELAVPRKTPGVLAGVRPLSLRLFFVAEIGRGGIRRSCDFGRITRDREPEADSFRRRVRLTDALRSRTRRDRAFTALGCMRGEKA